MKVLDYQSVLSSPEQIQFQKFTLNNLPPCNQEGLVSIFDIIDILQENMLEELKKVFPEEKIIEIAGFVITENSQALSCECFIFFRGKKLAFAEMELNESLTSWILHFGEGEEEKACSLFGLLSSSCQGGSFIMDWYDEFQSDPAKTIKRIAPREFDAEKIEKEKQTYYKKHLNFNRNINEETIRAAWSKLASTYELETNDGIDISPHKNEFQELTGFDFPKELEILLSISNGCKLGSHLEFLSFENILTEWKIWKDVEKTWTLEELMGNTEGDRNKTLGLYTCPFHIPIMKDAGGNGIAMDFCPGKDGQAGQIIVIGRDEDTRIHVANSLQEFFEKLTDKSPQLKGHSGKMAEQIFAGL